MVGLIEKHFLEFFEELIKTRWAYTSQRGLAKPDWYQRGTIGYFDGTFAGLIDGWFD